MGAEGITAAGLVAASAARHEGRPRGAEPGDHDVLEDWMRDSHDLWHVVTGYHGDLIGEAALLAFSFAQTRHPGVGLIVAAALLEATILRGRAKLGQSPADDQDARPIVIRGFLRGLRSKWLVAQDWEALLPRPLADVRRELGLEKPPEYVPVRKADLAQPLAA
jgi:ubiquinone biosynthesis protein COQ4